MATSGSMFAFARVITLLSAKTVGANEDAPSENVITVFASARTG